MICFFPVRLLYVQGQFWKFSLVERSEMLKHLRIDFHFSPDHHFSTFIFSIHQTCAGEQGVDYPMNLLKGKVHTN